MPARGWHKSVSEDKKDDIDKCLNCPYPKCINCLSRPVVERGIPKEDLEKVTFLDRARFFGPYSSFGNAAIYKFWTLGYSDAEISVALRCTKSAVWQVRNQISLMSPRGASSRATRLRTVNNWKDQNRDVAISLEEAYEKVSNNEMSFQTRESDENNVDIDWKFKIRKTNAKDVYLCTAIYVLWKNGYYDIDISRILHKNEKGIIRVRNDIGLPRLPHHKTRLLRESYANEFLCKNPEFKAKYNRLELKLQRGEEP